MILRRLLLSALVAYCALQLPGCGVTQWQRDQDALWGAIEDLNSPQMNAAISRANPGVPRVGNHSEVTP